ncbi:MAG: hypothetical protein HQK59_16980, partial [Deltaproteobacteria bacterium]|nr:hypothetical protein [Deltaproteobacteria bacterium]
MSQKRWVWGLALIIVLLALPLFLSRFYLYLLALIAVTGLLATSRQRGLGFGGMA